MSNSLLLNPSKPAPPEIRVKDTQNQQGHPRGRPFFFSKKGAKPPSCEVRPDPAPDPRDLVHLLGKGNPEHLARGALNPGNSCRCDPTGQAPAHARHWDNPRAAPALSVLKMSAPVCVPPVSSRGVSLAGVVDVVVSRSSAPVRSLP